MFHKENIDSGTVILKIKKRRESEQTDKGSNIKWRMSGIRMDAQRGVNVGWPRQAERTNTSYNRVYMTVYGKTRHMGFSVKIEFDVSLISSALELTHLQV